MYKLLHSCLLSFSNYILTLFQINSKRVILIVKRQHPPTRNMLAFYKVLLVETLILQRLPETLSMLKYWKPDQCCG